MHIVQCFPQRRVVAQIQIPGTTILKLFIYLFIYVFIVFKNMSPTILHEFTAHNFQI